MKQLGIKKVKHINIPFYEKEITYIKNIYNKGTKKDNIRKEKHIKHYLKHGWWDGHTWAADVSIAKFALPILQKTIKNKPGIPIGLTAKEWKKITDKILWALNENAYPEKSRELIAIELFRKNHHIKVGKSMLDNIWDSKKSQTRWLKLLKDHRKELDTGLLLFGKYFGCYWS